MNTAAKHGVTKDKSIPHKPHSESLEITQNAPARPPAGLVPQPPPQRSWPSRRPPPHSLA